MPELPEPAVFSAPLLRQEGPFRFHFLPVPLEVSSTFHQAGVRRVIATLNGQPFRRALQSDGDGGHFLTVGQSILRDLRVREGDTIRTRLAPDPDPDRIDLGEEFTAVLEQDEEAAARFFAFTPGRQRSYASYVTGAKRVETRIKRALELAHKLRTHTLYGDLNPDA